MSKRKLLSFCFGMLLYPLCYGQSQTMKGGGVDEKLKPGVGGDKNSGSLYTPNLYNGTANVSVPIYSNSDVDISFNYNTAGVKVDEMPGPIGLHWTLNAGGSITRVLKDIPDEINIAMNETLSPQGTGNPADAGNYGLKGKWSQYMGTNQSNPNYDEARYMDDESDDFLFSVGGLSFTFNIGKDRFIFTNPHTNIKIDILINGAVVTQMPLIPNGLENIENLSFRIRDAEGNWYYFVPGDIGIKNYGDDETTYFLTYKYVSKWVIKKIVKSSGDEINFDYDISNATGKAAIYQSFSRYEVISGIQNIVTRPILAGEFLVSTSRITAIHYPNGVMASFTYNANSADRCDDPGNSMSDPILSKICVSEGANGNCYVLQQAYMITPASAPYNSYEAALTTPCHFIEAATPSNPTYANSSNYRYHRLILKGITMSDINNTVSEPYYLFAYNLTPSLPPRLSGAQDFYGYYNGQAVSASYNGMFNIPEHMPKYGSSSVYGVNRGANSYYAMAGNLIKVVNAFGGETTFEYGEHQLSNVTATGGITLPTDNYFMGKTVNDGVCLKSITKKDVRYTGQFTKETYTYSGGQMFMPGGYIDYQINSAQQNSLFNNNFVTPHQFVNGSNHGYSNVVVTTTNASSEQLSKRSITYRNISMGNNNTSYFKTGNKNYFQFPFTDKQYIKDWELGLPLEITDYDKNNQIVTKTINTYDLTSLKAFDPAEAAGKVENLKIMRTNYPGPIELGTDTYHPFTGKALLMSSAVRKYTSNTNYVEDIVTYDYNYKNSVSTIMTKNSRSEYGYVRNVYNYEVSGPDATDGNQPGTTLYNMTLAGLEKIVSVERWKVMPTVPPNNFKTDQLLDASITLFSYNNNIIRTTKSFLLQNLEPVSYIDYTGITMGGPLMSEYGKVKTAYSTLQAPAYFQEANAVLQTDSKGNATEMQQMGTDIYTAMIWDMNGNMAAVVNNARLKDIGFTSFERVPEGNVTGNAEVVDGGFTYKFTVTSNAGAISGNVAFSLSPASYMKSPMLTSGQQYIITLWSKGAAPLVSGAGVTLTFTPEYTNGDWSFYKAVFTPASNGILNFSSPVNIKLDEIRLFPAGTTMKSSVYAPLLGVTSNTDPSGRITYYEYDAFGRQVIARNQEGNILSKKEYNLAQ